MSDRRRILLVKPILPYPPDQGTRVVSSAIIESLSQVHDVTVLARVLAPGEVSLARELEERCARVVTVFPKNRRSVSARILYRAAYGVRSWLTGRSLKGLYDCPGAFVRAARELAREDFDLVILEYWQLFPLQRLFDADRSVLLTHDIDLFVNRQRALLEGGLFAKAAALRRWRMEQREEVRAYQRARNVWALTARDADAVRKLSLGRAHVNVLPFGLAEDRFVGEPSTRDTREVLFLGAMGAAFNRDALAYFVRDIHPLVATIDGIRFTLVGGALPTEVAFFGEFRNVEVAGHARDVAPFFARCACLVVPLRYGGGLRIRILEAMAAGVPVVASPVAVQGMNFEPGRHVLIASTPAEYRSHIERVVSDPSFALELARRARDHVHAAYGPAARGEGIRHAAGEILLRTPSKVRP